MQRRRANTQTGKAKAEACSCTRMGRWTAAAPPAHAPGSERDKNTFIDNLPPPHPVPKPLRFSAATSAQ